jgi:hypothetical protein
VFHPTHVNRNKPLFAEACQSWPAAASVDVTAFPEDDPGDGLTAADAIHQWLQAGLPLDRLTCSSDGAGCMPKFDAHGHICAMDIGRPRTLVQTIAGLRARAVPWPQRSSRSSPATSPTCCACPTRAASPPEPTPTWSPGPRAARCPPSWHAANGW